jgi:uncharacterized protein YgbK (DUF1537 family)
MPEPVHGTVPLADLLVRHPPARDVDAEALATAVATGPRLVVLDDDPTGTQSIRDLPVLTDWSPDDLAWAFAQPAPGFFVLTNSRSLDEAEARRINREIAGRVAEAAAVAGVGFAIASRSDSTLRGHYPAETDELADVLAASSRAVDGVLIVPAFIEPGRVTVDSVHWMRAADGMVRVGESEFARDRTFGYASSDLRDWVQEKTGGAVRRDEVARITLTDLRTGGPDAVADILRSLTDGRPVVVDAVTDADLRALVMGLLAAEAEGRRFLARCGPSFVRARVGQVASPPADLIDLSAAPPEPDDTRSSTSRGLVVVGSHVDLTTRQLDTLRTAGGIVEVELDVAAVLDPDHRAEAVARTIAGITGHLLDAAADTDVVLRTSRTLVAGRDAASSLEIARSVSAALVECVRGVVAAVRPGFVVAKGGITSSDVATAGLGIRRAWSRGTVLPGAVSVWEPVSGPATGLPYVVFAGNVGDDVALRDAVSRLRDARA